ncbi:MAG TPA: 3-dehydroquinate synthase [Azospirillaceae bacterium]|nr:3-dehydroquinate synthase [Azospirillaceae bacterium]
MAEHLMGEAEGIGARCLMQRFTVAFEYPVHFTRGLFDPRNPLLADTMARPARFIAILDDGLVARRPDLPTAVARYADAHRDRITLAAPPETVPGGEAAKNDPALVEALQRRMRDLAIDRHAYVLAIGGGAVLDLAGYVAATTHRGVRLIRVPTTVLAQNDAGVGVKNSVNAFGAKNFLGTFAPPWAVLNDLGLLATLDPRDRRAGMAEAVKVALIRDAAFFAWLERSAGALARFEDGPVATMVERCAGLHLNHITQGGDPFETGSARPLDFGHWAAHRLEIVSGHALRHGEAVAIGIALDARYSVLAGLLATGLEERISGLLENLGFRLWHPAMADGPALLTGLREFREHLGGELTVTLLAGIGRGVDVHVINGAAMLVAVEWLRRRDGGMP